MPRQRPLRQRQSKTVFLPVPTWSWPLVSTGQVSEYRCAVGNVPHVLSAPTPTLAVAYRRRRDAYDYRLMMLEAVRREALGAITEEGLAAAGYRDDYARFARDWIIAEKRRRGFEPLLTVVVCTVRPIQPGDLEAAGAALIEHLYGSYVEEAQERPRTIPTKRRPAPAARHGRARATAPGRRAA